MARGRCAPPVLVLPAGSTPHASGEMVRSLMHGRDGLVAARLRSEDTVRIRSAADILATLDKDGTLNGLPFMPEMLRWAGTTVQVSARADKTCDTLDFKGLRRLTGTVHLDDLRCDGSAHGGCQAGCLLFWKEEWLQPAQGDEQPTESTAEQVA